MSTVIGAPRKVSSRMALSFLGFSCMSLRKTQIWSWTPLMGGVTMVPRRMISVWVSSNGWMEFGPKTKMCLLYLNRSWR